MSKGLRRFAGVPLPPRKERDEDLLLFRELQKKERDRLVSLLQPVSEDFESNGNFPIFRMPSMRKGSAYEFLGDNEKTDYNWLKTPPATPLFQSLEMDAIALQPAVQRELPIVHPLSRFAGNSVTPKESNEVYQKTESNETIKSPTPKQKAPPRSMTPSQRPTIAAATETKPNKPTPFSNQKMNQSMNGVETPIARRASNPTSPVAKPVVNTQRKEGPSSFLASNLTKSMGASDTRLNSVSKGLSPMARLTIPDKAPVFTDEKTQPQGIGRSKSVRSSSVARTESPRSPSDGRQRSASALRGRNQKQSSVPAANANAVRKPESSPRSIARQSCSPCVTRGRRVEAEKESIKSNNAEACSPRESKARMEVAGGNGAQFLGSRMVDKFMNARKTSTEQRETRSSFRGAVNESYGYGKNMMSRSSLDMSLRHMDVKREPAGAWR